jgi:hypothetical protein
MKRLKTAAWHGAGPEDGTAPALMLGYQKSRGRRAVLGPGAASVLDAPNTNSRAARRAVGRAGDFWYSSMSPHGTPSVAPARTLHASRLARSAMDH